MENYEEDEQVIDLGELVRLLLSHALQIIAVGVAAAVVCLLVCTFVLVPKYQASINMIVNTRQDGATNVTNDNINSATNMIDTYAVVIKSNTVLNQVIDQLNLSMSYDSLYSAVEVSSVDSTQIMRITVTNTDPALAGEITQTIADVVPDIIMEKVEAGSCKVVSDVSINLSPVYPQTKKYTAVAAVLGIVAACAVLILNHLLHNVIVDDEDVQTNLDLPVLGLIPEV